MKRIKLIMSIFALFAFVAISNTAFADDGNWDVTPSAQALAAASSYSFDQAHLKAFASEGGADVIPSAKALAAAKFYQYNESKVAAGVEDGADNMYFASKHQSADVKAIVNHASNDSLMCQSC